MFKNILLSFEFYNFYFDEMDNLKYKYIDLAEEQIIIKQLELISDKNNTIISLQRQNNDLRQAFDNIQNSWSYKIGRMITTIICSPITILKQIIKFSATVASHFPWFTKFIKKVIHLVPPLEAKVLSIIAPSSVNNIVNNHKEELIFTEEGQKIYDELMMRIEKQK